jgi:4a-hydroxytetrahydrobiopterin dehydratase
VTAVLTSDELRRALDGLPGWSGDPTGIRRTVEAPDFPTAIRVVDDVAAAAEEIDHHPDIDIRWRRLTFVLSTHSAGGVTERDVDLARRIDAVATRHGAG